VPRLLDRVLARLVAKLISLGLAAFVILIGVVFLRRPKSAGDATRIRSSRIPRRAKS
jgi:hypothetical protein